MPDIKLFTSVSEAVNSIFGESRYVVKKNYVAGTDTGFSFLLLTYIRGGGRISHYWETFAEELAAIHRADLPEFGKSDEMVCRTVDIVRKTRFAIAERHLRHLPHRTYPAVDGKQGPYGHP